MRPKEKGWSAWEWHHAWILGVIQNRYKQKHFWSVD